MDFSSVIKIPIFFFATIFLYIILVSGEEKIDDNLKPVLDRGENSSILIHFASGIKSSLERASQLRATIPDRGQRNTEILKILAENADSSQVGVLTLLSTRPPGESFRYFKQFKSGNLLLVKDATPELINALAGDPEVSKIQKEPVARLVPIEEDDDEDGLSELKGANSRPNRTEYQLNITQVPEAWAELGDRRGDGVILGTIDTGVTVAHESLQENFVGIEYGWYDPINKSPEPIEYDTALSHGTGTLGLAVGKYGIGPAPGAKWMTCAGCNLTHCEAEHLLSCIEFMECPTLPDGTNPDCSKAPHVVSNSWNSVRNETGYSDFILRWREMNIIPVFAIGNTGPECETTAAPGEYPFVLGIAATDRDDATRFFNGVGPATDGGIKPDLLAPGHKTKTATQWETLYSRRTGTSMACPVAAGVVALLKVRDLDATFEEIFDLLVQNTDRNITRLGNDADYCDQPFDEYPNNLFGYGRINALKAIQAQTELLNNRNN